MCLELQSTLSIQSSSLGLWSELHFSFHCSGQILWEVKEWNLNMWCGMVNQWLPMSIADAYSFLEKAYGQNCLMVLFNLLIQLAENFEKKCNNSSFMNLYDMKEIFELYILFCLVFFSETICIFLAYLFIENLMSHLNSFTFMFRHQWLVTSMVSSGGAKLAVSRIFSAILGSLWKSLTCANFPEKTIEGTAAGITSVLVACSVLLPLLASTGYIFTQVGLSLPLSLSPTPLVSGLSNVFQQSQKEIN